MMGTWSTVSPATWHKILPSSWPCSTGAFTGSSWTTVSTWASSPAWSSRLGISPAATSTVWAMPPSTAAGCKKGVSGVTVFQPAKP